MTYAEIEQLADKTYREQHSATPTREQIISGLLAKNPECYETYKSEQNAAALKAKLRLAGIRFS